MLWKIYVWLQIGAAIFLTIDTHGTASTLWAVAASMTFGGYTTAMTEKRAYERGRKASRRT